MAKQAVSVTLDHENLVWLRGRVGAGASGSLSELLDDLVTAARSSGAGISGGVRSVVGTIDIATDDPELLGADSYVRTEVERSLRRPMLVKEPAPPRKRSSRG
jgi:hypothetical protein